MGLKGHKWPFAAGTEWGTPYSRHEVPNSPFQRTRRVRAPQFDASGNDAPSAKVQLARCDERWRACAGGVTLYMEPSGHAPLSKPGTENPRCLRSACPSPTTVVICPLVNSRRTEIRERERDALSVWAVWSIAGRGEADRNSTEEETSVPPTTLDSSPPRNPRHTNQRGVSTGGGFPPAAG